MGDARERFESDRLIRRLCERQQGMVAWSQLRAAAVSRSAIRHRIVTGWLVRWGSRVLGLAGVSPNPKQELMAAVLDAGPQAAVSHEAAAALWGLPGFWPGSLDVSRPRGRFRGVPMLGELHEPVLLPPTHLTTVDGIPVTNVARTVFDLAGAPGLSAARVERALDNAINRGPFVLPQLRTMLDELGGPGRPGILLMRELLAARPPDYVPPASGLEARVIELLDAAGIATRRQVDLGGECWIGRVDLLVLGTKVVVEADSALHHTSMLDRERDERRDEHLGSAGFFVVRVTDEEAFHRPWVVAPRVADAVRRAGAA